jgi:hypothetical protein
MCRCKKEGRRLDEKEYIIEKPQGLVLTGTKRRKSMEPGKVRALALNGQDSDLLEPSSKCFHHITVVIYFCIDMKLIQNKWQYPHYQVKDHHTRKIIYYQVIDVEQR